MKKNKSASSNNAFLSGLLKKNTAGWFVLIIFTSIWMFVLGIMVGRGTAPIQFEMNPLQKELSAKKNAEIQNEIDRIKVDPNSTTKEKNLKFYEDLKGTGTRKKADRKKTKQTVTKKKILKVQSHVKADSKKKRFTIQVASFKDPKDAEQMVKQLKNKGYSAYRIIGKIPEKGIWYRVRTGNFKNKEDAVRIMKNLKNDGFSAFIINR